MAKKARSRKTKKVKRHSKRSYRRHSQRRGRQAGGNYATDVTTRTFEGIPTKPLNKFVVAVPGRGVMSGAAYAQMMSDIDRNGDHLYD